MTGEPEARRDAIAALVPPLLKALETLGLVTRYLHPPNLPRLVESVKDVVAPVREARDGLYSAAWPEDHHSLRDRLDSAAKYVCLAFDGLAEAAADPNGLLNAFRAMRNNTRAMEALYPLANHLPPISRFFIDDDQRTDESLLARLSNSDPKRDEVGITHIDNARENRGGYSVYVPEYYEPDKAHPLVVTLHGGSGHGADFLWTWLRTARSRGVILLSPTSVERTWALGGPDVDSLRIHELVSDAREQWNIDPSKLLLTGMSDGGTFGLISGLRDDSPFTHLAPSSTGFHSVLLQNRKGRRLKGLPIYLIHGALDWMFPVDRARTASTVLENAGADITYREIEDLSHTYPQDENPRIMDWFLGAN